MPTHNHHLHLCYHHQHKIVNQPHSVTVLFRRDDRKLYIYSSIYIYWPLWAVQQKFNTHTYVPAPKMSVLLIVPTYSFLELNMTFANFVKKSQKYWNYKFYPLYVCSRLFFLSVQYDILKIGRFSVKCAIWSSRSQSLTVPTRCCYYYYTVKVARDIAKKCCESTPQLKN